MKMRRSPKNRARARLMERLKTVAIVVALVALVGLGFHIPLSTAEGAHAIPAAASDETNAATTEVAVLAGGCFWGVQGVFQHTEGVLNAVSGYAGGEEKTASYYVVGSGTTGHAESVQVTFDPRKISYGRILQIYFSVAHDPTEVDRQGPDEGTQYRSAVFPISAEQERVAKAYIAQLDKAHVFDGPIATKIETGKTFYPAEDYHQDYLTLNPGAPYIVMFDLPKIEDLKHFFPDLYRPTPVLVSDARKAGH
jgi:peptide-methionine (S)-S-oxide reductase